MGPLKVRPGAKGLCLRKLVGWRLDNNWSVKRYLLMLWNPAFKGSYAPSGLRVTITPVPRHHWFGDRKAYPGVISVNIGRIRSQKVIVVTVAFVQQHQLISKLSRVPPLFQHWFSMTFPWPKKRKSMILAQHIFQVNDIRLMNAYQN